MLDYKVAGPTWRIAGKVAETSWTPGAGGGPPDPPGRGPFAGSGANTRIRLNLTAQ